MWRAGFGPCDRFREAGENDVTPPGSHAIERVGHPFVVQVKAALLQKHPGTRAFRLKPPGKGPGGGEGVDEAAGWIHLEHLAGLLAVARHVNGELVTNHRRHPTLGPPESHQLGLGQQPPHFRRRSRHKLVHSERGRR